MAGTCQPMRRSPRCAFTLTRCKWEAQMPPSIPHRLAHTCARSSLNKRTSKTVSLLRGMWDDCFQNRHHVVCSQRSMPGRCGETMSKLSRYSSAFVGPGGHLSQNGDNRDNKVRGVVWGVVRTARTPCRVRKNLSRTLRESSSISAEPESQEQALQH